ncbi:hypothetical protein HYE67_001345 [Fusarium culmorum]|uniref:RBR-type E3 ubiquitin transferase n=1 Tax=Fusarium culmorum TaxID=5516 RepID=A0A7S8CZB7_FUSCU|nr:hypothetical protein HYE67_001345 [Fusarium culmorum]
MDISSLLLADVPDDVPIDILRSLNLVGLPDSMSGQTESSSWASSRNESQTTECIACNNQFPPLALFKPLCSHEYCRACLAGLVRSSLQNESLFPPKCCGQAIPIKQGRWLSPQLVGQFQAKKLDFDTPNRTYCSEPSCSTFIPPVFINGEAATCPRCSRRACIHCKGSHHTGVCPSDTASQQFLQLAVQNGWQQCYSCHQVVKLDTGCYQMTCHCRAEFCYLCGNRWKLCSCPQWDEDRLIRRANAVVDRDDNADRMDAAMRQAHVEEERVNLMENHECPHRVWGLRAGDHQCSVALTGSERLLLATSVYEPLSHLD